MSFSGSVGMWGFFHEMSASWVSCHERKKGRESLTGIYYKVYLFLVNKINVYLISFFIDLHEHSHGISHGYIAQTTLRRTISDTFNICLFIILEVTINKSMILRMQSYDFVTFQRLQFYVVYWISSSEIFLLTILTQRITFI